MYYSGRVLFVDVSLRQGIAEDEVLQRPSSCRRFRHALGVALSLNELALWLALVTLALRAGLATVWTPFAAVAAEPDVKARFASETYVL